MADSFMGRCGVDCEACEYRKQMGCPGCQAAEGKLFWGECAVAKCCLGEGHDHCGRCQEFPCAMLNEYAFDQEHGDQGARIRNLEAWNEKGYDAWQAEKRQRPASGDESASAAESGTSN